MPTTRQTAIIGVTALAIAIAAPIAWMRLDDNTLSATDIQEMVPHSNPHNTSSYFDAYGHVPGDGTTDNTYELVHEASLDDGALATLLTYIDESATNPKFIDYKPQYYDPDTRVSGRTDLAADLAARAVHYLGTREDAADLPAHLQEKATKGGATSLAHLLSTYMRGVTRSLGSSNNFGPQIYSIELASGPGAVAPIPSFNSRPLRRVMRMALATDAGLAELRSGINDYSERTLVATADGRRGRAGGETRQLLTWTLSRHAELESYVLGLIRTDPTRTDRERKVRASVWLSAGSDAFASIRIASPDSYVAAPKGQTLPAAIIRTKGVDTDRLLQALKAKPFKGTTADDAGLVLQEEYLAMVMIERAGLWVDAEALDAVRPHGSLLSWDDFSSLDETAREELLDTALGPKGSGDSLHRAELFSELTERAGLTVPRLDS